MHSADTPRENTRVLHVLHHSLPELSGYAMRSSYIIQQQRSHGIEPFAVTSVRQPGEPSGCEPIAGTPHRRTPPLPRGFLPLPDQLGAMRALRRSVTAAIEEWKPDLVHAHSPMLVGLPALAAARRAGLPFVYEVRDLWENASVDRGKFSEGSLQYRIARGLESRVFRRADAVVTICEALKDAVAPRVGPHTSVHVVGNGVEAARFKPGISSNGTRARWKLEGKRVIGYLGTFQPWEGLSTLLAAMPGIVEALPDAHLVIVGGGGQLEDLEAKARELGVTHLVTFTGRVPHDTVDQVYALADLMVYPRILTRTTALTTPLKPLEAMAMARPVMISDVPAMLELVRPGETGLTFRAGDSKDLAKTCIAALRDTDLCAKLGANAREWVVRERDWHGLVGRYAQIYAAARESRARRTAS